MICSIWVRSDARHSPGWEADAAVGPLAAELGGRRTFHGGAARGAELGGGAGLSIWGSRWAGEMAAGDGDKGLASGS